MLVPRVAAIAKVGAGFQRAYAPCAVGVLRQHLAACIGYGAEAAQVVGMHIAECLRCTHLLGYSHLAIGQVNIVNFFGYTTNRQLLYSPLG